MSLKSVAMDPTVVSKIVTRLSKLAGICTKDVISHTLMVSTAALTTSRVDKKGGGVAFSTKFFKRWFTSFFFFCSYAQP